MNPTTAIALSDVSHDIRATFIKKTYTHLAIGVMAFIVIEYLIFQTGLAYLIAEPMMDGYNWLFVLGAFMFISYKVESWAKSSVSRTNQYIAFVLYIVLEAVIFIPLLYMATAYTGGNVIKEAAVISLSLFLGLTTIALSTGRDFSFLRNALIIGSFISLGIIVMGVLTGFSLGLFFSFAMVALAAGSILYQTSNLIHYYNTSQHVAAALGLFASLMLLFWYVLQIVVGFDGD
jgi:hypothetical protein